MGSGVWAAPAIQVPTVANAFDNPEGQGLPCDSQVLDVTTKGNGTYLELLNHGLMVSVDPRLTGPATVEEEVNINNINGHIGGHGSLCSRAYGLLGHLGSRIQLVCSAGQIH